MGRSQTNPMGADPRFRQMGQAPQPPQFGQDQPPQVQAGARMANPLNAFPTMARPPQSNGMQMGLNNGRGPYPDGDVVRPPFAGQPNPFPNGRGPYPDRDILPPPFTGRPNPFPNGRGPYPDGDQRFLWNRGRG